MISENRLVTASTFVRESKRVIHVYGTPQYDESTRVGVVDCNEVGLLLKTTYCDTRGVSYETSFVVFSSLSGWISTRCVVTV